MLDLLLQASGLLPPTNSSFYVATAATFTENTIAVMLTLLTILAVSIQIARGYFLRVLRKFTLRVAADIWWLLFVILRDASIFLVVFLGFMLFYPGTYQDFPIAVPAMPLAVDLYAIALVILLVKDTDEEPKWNTAITILVALGTVLYITGTIFVTESAVQLAKLPPTVSAQTSNIWGFMYTTFNSQTNPALSIYSFYICFGILAAAGLVAFVYGLKGGTPRNQIKTVPNPVVMVKDPAPTPATAPPQPAKAAEPRPQAAPPRPKTQQTQPRARISQSLPTSLGAQQQKPPSNSKATRRRKTSSRQASKPAPGQAQPPSK